jgi:MFS family permease
MKPMFGLASKVLCSDAKERMMDVDNRRTQEPEIGLYRWELVAMLWAVAFCNFADRSIMAAVLPQIRHDFGFTSAQLGLLSTAFLWVYAFSSPVAGVIGDIVRRKWVIVSALAFWSLVTLMTPLASGMLFFAACRALVGLGEAFNFPSATALIARYHGPETRSRAFAWHQTALPCGQIAGAAAAGFLAQFYHWRVPFVVFAIFGLMIAIFIALAMRNPPSRHRNAANTFRPRIGPLLANRSIAILAMVNFGALFVAWTMNTWLPTFLHDRYQLSLGLAATIGPLAMQLSTMAAVIVGGFVTDKLLTLTSFARFYTIAFGLICGAPFVALAGNAGHLSLVVVCLIFVGVFKGFIDANMFAATQDVLPADIRATGFGIVQCVGVLGGGIAPFLVGVYAPKLGLGPAMGLTSMFYFGAGALVLIFHKSLSTAYLSVGTDDREIACNAYDEKSAGASGN